jgi:hypothetical protein
MKSMQTLIDDLSYLIRHQKGKLTMQPHFNGPDYVPARDDNRLNAQYERIFHLMVDGVWRTLNQIHQLTGDPEASISAQLRHMRKPRFGSHTVDKEYLGNGLYQYRVTE